MATVSTILSPLFSSFSSASSRFGLVMLVNACAAIMRADAAEATWQAATYGFEAIVELSRSTRVVRSFHGHQHHDRSEAYALVRDKLGFDTRAVDYCGIKNGLGESIRKGSEKQLGLIRARFAMVKILVLSDLHLEQARFLPNVAATRSCDVVVLAGDIHTGDSGIRWARETFAKKPIVYVAGNHEFYGQDWDAGLNTMRETARALDVQFLENDCVEICGIRFLGATLWTDFEYQGSHLVDKLKKQAYDWFLDYTAIKSNAQGKRLTPDMSISRHQQSRAWLAAELEKGDAAVTVVVTHHYPHKNSTPARYALDGMTACYGSHLPENLLLKAGLWIHGHTHASHNYRIDGRSGHQNQYLRVICNPRGNLSKGTSVGAENANFNPGLLIESLPDGNWGEHHDTSKRGFT